MGPQIYPTPARKQLQAVSDELVGGRDAHAGKYHSGLGTALLSGHQNLGAGRALGIGQHAVLLDDQRLAQRNHEQHAQHAAAEGDQGNLNQRRGSHSPIAHPHK